MSNDPRDQSQTPEELLAETDSLLSGTSETAQPPVGQSPTPQTQTPQSPKPAVVAKSGAGMSAGMWVSLILGAVIVVLLLIFIVQNNETAQFTYFSAQFSLPLGVAMLFAAIGGILIAGLVGSVRIFVLGRRLKKISKALGN